MPKNDKFWTCINVLFSGSQGPGLLKYQISMLSILNMVKTQTKRIKTKVNSSQTIQQELCVYYVKIYKGWRMRNWSNNFVFIFSNFLYFTLSLTRLLRWMQFHNCTLNTIWKIQDSSISSKYGKPSIIVHFVMTNLSLPGFLILANQIAYIFCSNDKCIYERNVYQCIPPYNVCIYGKSY